MTSNMNCPFCSQKMHFDRKTVTYECGEHGLFENDGYVEENQNSERSDFFSDDEE